MWMLKIAYKNIEDELLKSLQSIGGQWNLDSRLDTNDRDDKGKVILDPAESGRMVHEINLSYKARAVKMPYDKFFVVVWLQVAGDQPEGKRRFRLQFGHPDVSFEVHVMAPMKGNPHSDRLIAATDVELHTPKEVAEFVWNAINNWNDDDNNEKEEDPRPTPSPEFAPVGAPDLDLQPFGNDKQPWHDSLH